MSEVNQNKELYRELCRKEYIPLHSKDWWLDTVCGINNWQVALLRGENNTVKAALPYTYVRKNTLFTQIGNPLLSIYSYLYLQIPQNPDINPRKTDGKKIKLTAELIKSVPRSTFHRQLLHPQTDILLPFLWNKYNCSYGFTYRLQLDKERSYEKNIAYNIRHDIKQTLPKIEIVESRDYATLFQLNAQSYRRQNRKVPYTEDFIQNICRTLEHHNASHLLLAQRKTDKKPIAALLTAFDEECAYALVAGQSSSKEIRSPLNCLYLSALKNAAQRVSVFDFEGSSVPGIEHVYRNFGAERTPYPVVTRFKNRLWKAAAVLGGII